MTAVWVAIRRNGRLTLDLGDSGLHQAIAHLRSTERFAPRSLCALGQFLIDDGEQTRIVDRDVRRKSGHDIALAAE